MFTGAGVSAESGLRTFRDGDGLWESTVWRTWPPRSVEPRSELVLRFYDERRTQVRKAVPNAAHLAIAALQDRFEVDVVTQNIDDLHEGPARNASCTSMGRSSWRAPPWTPVSATR